MSTVDAAMVLGFKGINLVDVSFVQYYKHRNGRPKEFRKKLPCSQRKCIVASALIHERDYLDNRWLNLQYLGNHDEEIPIKMTNKLAI